MATPERKIPDSTGDDRPADLQRAIDLAIDRKGTEILLMDLRGVSNATDYFLLINGTSDTHVRSIADHCGARGRMRARLSGRRR